MFLDANGFLAVKVDADEIGFFAPPTVGAPITVLARFIAASAPALSSPSLLRPFFGTVVAGAVSLLVLDIVEVVLAILPGAASLEGRGVGIPLIVRKM